MPRSSRPWLCSTLSGHARCQAQRLFARSWIALRFQIDTNLAWSCALLSKERGAPEIACFCFCYTAKGMALLSNFCPMCVASVIRENQMTDGLTRASLINEINHLSALLP